VLLKTDHDAIGKVRSDPRVRGLIELYRKYLKYPDESKKLLNLATGFSFEKRYNFESVLSNFLSMAIYGIGEAYREVTGKSPRTVDPITNKRPFDSFVIKLFNREGLDPPTTYEIRQVTNPPTTKKNK
jgi:hypothetical protein